MFNRIRTFGSSCWTHVRRPRVYGTLIAIAAVIGLFYSVRWLMNRPKAEVASATSEEASTNAAPSAASRPSTLSEVQIVAPVVSQQNGETVVTNNSVQLASVIESLKIALAGSSNGVPKIIKIYMPQVSQSAYGNNMRVHQAVKIDVNGNATGTSRITYDGIPVPMLQTNKDSWFQQTIYLDMGGQQVPVEDPAP